MLIHRYILLSFYPPPPHSCSDITTIDVSSFCHDMFVLQCCKRILENTSKTSTTTERMTKFRTFQGMPTSTFMNLVACVEELGLLNCGYPISKPMIVFSVFH